MPKIGDIHSHALRFILLRVTCRFRGIDLIFGDNAVCIWMTDCDVCMYQGFLSPFTISLFSAFSAFPWMASFDDIAHAAAPACKARHSCLSFHTWVPKLSGLVSILFGADVEKEQTTWAWIASPLSWCVCFLLAAAQYVPFDLNTRALSLDSQSSTYTWFILSDRSMLGTRAILSVQRDRGIVSNSCYFLRQILIKQLCPYDVVNFPRRP